MADKIELAEISIAVSGYLAFFVLITGQLANIGLQLQSPLKEIFLASSLGVALVSSGLVMNRRFGLI